MTVLSRAGSPVSFWSRVRRVERVCYAIGAALIATLATLTVRALGANLDAAASTRLALRAGFVTLLIALASCAVMIARGVILVRTGHQRAAYSAGGFLKPVHAVTMHGILVLP